MNFINFNIVALSFIMVSSATSAEMDISQGLYDIKWGDPKIDLLKKYPQPLGIIKAKDGLGVYFINPNLAFLYKDEVVVGVRCGDIFNWNFISEIEMGVGNISKQRINDKIIIGMSYEEAVPVFNIPKDIRKEYNTSFEHNGIIYNIECSGGQDKEGKPTYNLYAFIVRIADKKAKVMQGELEKDEVKTLF